MSSRDRAPIKPLCECHTNVTMDLKEKLLTLALTASVSVSGAVLASWRTVSVQQTEVTHLKEENAQMRKILDSHEEDIKKFYAVDGKLSQVIEELRALRMDIRANNARK
jgi:hypothetical protein